MLDEIVLLVTTPTVEEAEKISNRLVEEGLVACANIVPSVRSIFWWEGKVSRETEALIIMKSRRALFDRIVSAVKPLHSYTVPEIIALPIVSGSEEYLKWLRESTKRK